MLDAAPSWDAIVPVEIFHDSACDAKSTAAVVHYDVDGKVRAFHSPMGARDITCHICVDEKSRLRMIVHE